MQVFIIILLTGISNRLISIKSGFGRMAGNRNISSGSNTPKSSINVVQTAGLPSVI